MTLDVSPFSEKKETHDERGGEKAMIAYPPDRVLNGASYSPNDHRPSLATTTPGDSPVEAA